MSMGSGLFSNDGPRIPHLVNRSGGIPAELKELHDYFQKVFAPAAAIAVEEFTNPAAADTDAIKLEFASTLAASDFSGTALDGVVGTTTMSPPRNVTLDNDAGETPADAPATAHVYGLDIYGANIDEILTINQAGGQVVGNKAFARVLRVTMPAGDGTGAKLTIGFGAKIGLGLKAKARTGACVLIRELMDGSAPTDGALVAPATGAPNGTYAPNAAPNGTHDYAIYYEFDPTVL